MDLQKQPQRAPSSSSGSQDPFGGTRTGSKDTLDFSGVETAARRDHLNIYYERPPNLGDGISSLSTSIALPYMYDGDGGPISTTVSSADRSGSFTFHGFGMQQHIDPSQVFQTEHSGVRSRDVYLDPQDNMFSSGVDSDREVEEGTLFADCTIVKQQEYSHAAIDEPTMDMSIGGRSLQLDAPLPGQFDTQATRYPGSPPKKEVTISGTTTDMFSSPLKWDGSGASSGRAHTHSSATSSFNSRRNGNDRRPRITRTSSTPNASPLGEHTGIFDRSVHSAPSSPADLNGSMSGYSIAANRPYSPRNKCSSSNLSGQGGADNLIPTTCVNCFTQTTPLWRRNLDGHSLCNACGLFFKLHGVVRPLSLKTDLIRKRIRGSGATVSISSGGATTHAAKNSGGAASGTTCAGTTSGTTAMKSSTVALNSTNNTGIVTTPNSPQARSVRESESPISVSAARVNGINIAGSTPASDHGSTGSSGGGIIGGKTSVPIAAAPLNSAPETGLANSMPRTVVVVPKRQRRHSKSLFAVEGSGMDLDSPEARNDGMANPRMAGEGGGIFSGTHDVNIGSANGFGMTLGPIMLRLGPNCVDEPCGRGPQDWEWLTMSL